MGTALNIALARFSPIVFAVLLCDSAAIPTCRVHRLGSDVPRIICGHNKSFQLPIKQKRPCTKNTDLPTGSNDRDRKSVV